MRTRSVYGAALIVVVAAVVLLLLTVGPWLSRPMSSTLAIVAELEIFQRVCHTPKINRLALRVAPQVVVRQQFSLISLLVSV